MTNQTNPTPGQSVDTDAPAENHGSSQTARAFGQRPEGGSAETVEPINDALYPSAAVELGENNEKVPRLSREDAMTNQGFKSLPNDDDELTAGVGQKNSHVPENMSSGERIKPA